MIVQSAEAFREAVTVTAGLIERHLDTFVMLFVFIIMVGMVYHMAHDPMDSGNVNWAREQAGIILGALVMRRSSQTKQAEVPPNGDVKA